MPSATRRCGWQRSYGTQVKLVHRACSCGLVRPHEVARPRLALLKRAGLSGAGRASTSLPTLPQSEVETTRISCRQPVLHAGVCQVRQATLPQQHQGSAEEVHPDWQSVEKLHKHYIAARLERAGLPGPQPIGIDEISMRSRTDLPHRRQRPDSGSADLVRWQGSFGS